MGTNFYYLENTCPHCKRGEHERHIGKSSGGWCFSLHVYPEDGVNDLPDWEKLFEKPGSIIKDEYGDVVSVKDMLEWITRREGKPWPRSYPEMYSSWDDFHRKNHSMEGPKGLLRYVRDGARCLGHGQGTWDLLVGEFS
jgi:hypothetical protein